MNGDVARERGIQTAGAGPEVSVLNALHVIARFAIGWNAMSSVNCSLSCIVRR